MEDAADLGFPAIRLSTEIWGRSWDDSVYAGLRQFHEAKGFDPDSPNVVRYLGCPLYRLEDETDAPSAHEKTVDNGAQRTEPSSRNDEMPSVSQIFKFLMSLQLGLMIFPVLHSLHEHVWQACLHGRVEGLILVL
ncbi:hypothetical protein B0H13DRAFT_2037448 [Mycena leptocephala]|nr:hypothetical protein B0H13DRAFT_2037448 [Mycena leptocephala]